MKHQPNILLRGQPYPLAWVSMATYLYFLLRSFFSQSAIPSHFSYFFPFISSAISLFSSVSHYSSPPISSTPFLLQLPTPSSFLVLFFTHFYYFLFVIFPSSPLFSHDIHPTSIICLDLRAPILNWILDPLPSLTFPPPTRMTVPI